MPQSCVLSHCLYLPKNSNSITYHRFPVEEKSRTLWNEFVSKRNLALNRNCPVKSNSKLCSRHFTECCFELGINGKRQIKPGHCPSKMFRRDGNFEVVMDPHVIEVDVQESCEVDIDLHEIVVPAEDQALELENARKEILQLQIQLNEQRDFNMRQQTVITQKNSTVRTLKKRLNYYKSLQKPKQTKPITHNQKIQVKIVSDSQQYKHPLLASLDRRMSMPKTTPYEQNLKEFAVKLNYYSPAGYRFVRRELFKALPHPNSLSNYMSGLVIKPGFIAASLEHIKIQCAKSSVVNYFSLVMDEIAIRKQVEFDGEIFRGYEDYGDVIMHGPEKQVATHALFIYVQQINGTIKLPIAFFLTSGLKGEKLAKVLEMSLVKMNEVNAKVFSIGFDGFPSNFAALEELGACFKILTSAFQPWIPHPCTREEVYIFPDSAHMLKLFRNALSNFKEFIVDGSTEKVKWSFISELQKLQTSKGLRAGNKITIRHTHFHRQKMKVNLASQLISRSVADSLQACNTMNITEFAGSEATSECLKNVDRIFDLLNSRTCGLGQKSPIGLRNEKYWRKTIDDGKKYLTSLKVIVPKKRKKNQNQIEHEEKLLLDTKRGTCIKGMYVALSSLELLMDRYVLPENSDLLYIPTYKLGQDPLEIFFSIIRSRLGHNDNPNYFQLISAVRTILSTKLSPETIGNCETNEDTVTTSLGLKKKNIYTEMLEDTDDDIPMLPVMEKLCLYLENVVAYISGFVGKKVTKLLDCDLCCSALRDTSLHQIDFLPNQAFILINQKRFGDLFYPTQDLLSVCKHTEQVIRTETNIVLINFTRILALTVRRIMDSNAFAALKCQGHDPNHYYKLIKLVVASYLKIRFHHIAKSTTIKLHPENIRSTCTKTVQFRGQ